MYKRADAHALHPHIGTLCPVPSLPLTHVTQLRVFDCLSLTQSYSEKQGLPGRCWPTHVCGAVTIHDQHGISSLSNRSLNLCPMPTCAQLCTIITLIDQMNIEPSQATHASLEARRRTLMASYYSTPCPGRQAGPVGWLGHWALHKQPCMD